MEEESFIAAYMDMPEDLSGNDSRLYVFRVEDFGAWYRRVRDAHEREVDGGVAGMTDAQLADHGLCRIGSATMWDEVRDTKDRELSEEHGLVRLPVDAYGVPICVGDVMNSKVDYLFDGKPFTVRGLVLCEDGWEVTDGRFGNRYKPDSLRHYHAPTVETTLQEMLEQAVGYSDAHTTVALNAIAEYSAKLRLAGEDE